MNSSIRRGLSGSLSSIFETGMPVHLETTSATPSPRRLPTGSWRQPPAFTPRPSCHLSVSIPRFGDSPARARVVGGTHGLLKLELSALELLLHLRLALQGRLFGLPHLVELRELGFQLVDLLLELREPPLRRLVRLLAQGFLLDPELDEPA